MASDEEYLSFLEKADQDLSESLAFAKTQEAQGKAVFKTTDAGAGAPRVIQEACEDAVYVTDADEPFHEVCLKWDGEGLPDEGTGLKRQICLFHPKNNDHSKYRMLCYILS